MGIPSIRRLLGTPERAGVPDLERLRVRAMLPEDRAAVLRIESDSFPDAWPARTFDQMLALPQASGHVVAHRGEHLAFFVVVRAQDHLHLVNLAVAREARRRGLGTLCLHAVEKIAWAHGLARVELEVRETNLAAQLLYRSCGYRAVEIRRGYYQDQDAYRMTKAVRGVRSRA